MSRTDYYAQYYEQNKNEINQKRNLIFLEKKVLNQLDKYFVNFELMNKNEKDLFAAKEIALKIRILCDKQIDYKLIYDIYEKFALVSAQAINKPDSASLLSLDLVNSRRLILSKFYQFMALQPELDEHKESLLELSEKIENQHKKDLQTQEMINKGNQ